MVSDWVRQDGVLSVPFRRLQDDVLDQIREAVEDSRLGGRQEPLDRSPEEEANAAELEEQSAIIDDFLRQREAAEAEKDTAEASTMKSLTRGDRVRSLTAASHWTPRPLKFGDVGTVFAAKDANNLVLVEFDGEPRILGPLYENQLEKLEEDWLKPGDRVRSFAAMPSWNPRPLRIGDMGTVLAPKDEMGLVKVAWDGDPKMVGPLYENQLQKM